MERVQLLHHRFKVLPSPSQFCQPMKRCYASLCWTSRKLSSPYFYLLYLDVNARSQVNRFGHLWPLLTIKTIWTNRGISYSAHGPARVKLFNEPEINIDFQLSWPFFCQNAAEEIITSLAEKRKQTNNLIQGGAGAHSRFLKKAQSIAKLWWLGSDLHPLEPWFGRNWG